MNRIGPEQHARLSLAVAKAMGDIGVRITRTPGYAPECTKGGGRYCPSQSLSIAMERAVKVGITISIGDSVVTAWRSGDALVHARYFSDHVVAYDKATGKPLRINYDEAIAVAICHAIVGSVAA